MGKTECCGKCENCTCKNDLESIVLEVLRGNSRVDLETVARRVSVAVQRFYSMEHNLERYDVLTVLDEAYEHHMDACEMSDETIGSITRFYRHIRGEIKELME